MLLSRTLYWILLVVLMIVIWFGGLGYRKLADPDEGRYAEIPRHMVVSGDWITPRLNGIKYFEKPPLQYWATAAAYKVFGFGEGVARLWPALTGFLSIVLAGFIGLRMHDHRVGLYAAIVTGSCFYQVLFSHFVTLDMGLAFFLASAVFGFVLGQNAQLSSASEYRWIMLAWASMALAVLTKGLVGAALPLLTLIVYSAIHRDLSCWKRLHLVHGLILFVLLTVPWFVAVSLRNPEFPHFFFIHEHFARYASKAHNRPGPIWYFVPILLVGMLPWTGFLVEAARDAWREGNPGQHFRPHRFLLIWIVTVFGFFSVSSSKLPAYLLPVVPAMAVLIGHVLSRLSLKAILWRLIPGVIVLSVILFGASEALLHTREGLLEPEIHRAYGTWLKSAGVLLIVASAAAMFVRSARSSLLAVGGASLLSIQIALSGFESLSSRYSTYATAQAMRPHIKEGTQIYSVGRYDQSLAMYLGVPVILVAHADELAFGLQQEPDRWLPALEAFKPAWEKAPSAVAVISMDAYERLKAQGVAMKLLMSSSRRVAVVKPD